MNPSRQKVLKIVLVCLGLTISLLLILQKIKNLKNSPTAAASPVVNENSTPTPSLMPTPPSANIQTQENPNSESATAQNAKAQNEAGQSLTATNSTTETTFAAQISKQLSAVEIKSVKSLVQLMNESHRSFTSTEKIMKKFASLQLKPSLKSDSNQFTGKMDVIQNESRLPGIRYVTTQIMEDANKKQFVQRSSFELRPGPDSYIQAVKAVQESLPKGAKLAFSENNRTSWSLPGGTVRSVKVLKAADLVSTSYKVYDKKKDVGTVLVWEEEDVEDAFID